MWWSVASHKEQLISDTRLCVQVPSIVLLILKKKHEAFPIHRRLAYAFLTNVHHLGWETGIFNVIAMVTIIARDCVWL